MWVDVCGGWEGEQDGCGWMCVGGLGGGAGWMWVDVCAGVGRVSRMDVCVWGEVHGMHRT